MRNALFFMLCVMGLVSCGRYPANLRSGFDIEATSASFYAISIGDLPVELYPKLQKFAKVEQVLYKPNSEGAMDRKLQILSTLKFTRLGSINCNGLNKPGDVGVLSLVAIQSLEFLQLNNANITDQTIYGLERFPKLCGISVVGCEQITKDGVIALCKARQWREISFSGELLSMDDVLYIISILPNDVLCCIADKRPILTRSA
jgi:hypothetical protein